MLVFLCIFLGIGTRSGLSLLQSPSFIESIEIDEVVEFIEIVGVVELIESIEIDVVDIVDIHSNVLT